MNIVVLEWGIYCFDALVVDDSQFIHEKKGYKKASTMRNLGKKETKGEKNCIRRFVAF